MGSAPAAKQEGKLNYAQMSILCIVNFNEALQGNIIWPFIPFAVQRWGAHGDDVGLHVGTLASSFFLAQLLFVALWGKASDKYGRRPTLLFGLLGTGLSMALFGFAQSFPVALLARFLTGALNGNVAIAKTYVGEICDQSTISRGFGLLSFCWGFGAIVAPTLGGYLAEPASKYEVFKGVAFFESFPYMLPSLVSVAFSAFALIFGYFKLPETDVFKQGNHLIKKGINNVAPTRVATDDAPQLAGTFPETVSDDVETVAVELELPSVSSSSGSSLEDKATSFSIDQAELTSPTQSMEGDVVCVMGAPKTPPNTSASAATDAEDAALLKGGVLENDEIPPPPTTLMDVLRDKAIMSAITAYGILCIAQIMFDELFPVFLQTNVEDGGLGFDSNQVGSVQIIAGATQICFQLVIFPMLNNRFGPLRCFRHCMWPLGLLMVFPAIGRLHSDAVATWLALGVATVYKTSFMTVSFTSIMIAINNSSRGVSLGLINGVGQSTASLVRTVGPAIGGALYSGSLHWEALGNYKLHVVYVVQGLLCILGSLFSWKLPKWVNTAPKFGSAAAAASIE